MCGPSLCRGLLACVLPPQCRTYVWSEVPYSDRFFQAAVQFLQRLFSQHEQRVSISKCNVRLVLVGWRVVPSAGARNSTVSACYLLPPRHRLQQKRQAGGAGQTYLALIPRWWVSGSRATTNWQGMPRYSVNQASHCDDSTFAFITSSQTVTSTTSPPSQLGTLINNEHRTRWLDQQRA